DAIIARFRFQLRSRDSFICGLKEKTMLTLSKCASRFTFSAAIILLLTGIAKLWTAMGESKFLTLSDPIFGLSFRQLMFVVGLAEIGIALFCFLSKRQLLALGLIAWLASNFLIYRVGLWWM